MFQQSSRVHVLLDDFHKFLQLFDSIIIGRSGQRHVPWLELSLYPFASNRIAAATFQGRLGQRTRKSDFAPSEAASVSSRCDGHDRFSRSKNSIHFAWHHHAFEAALNRDDVGIRGSQH